MAKLVAIFLLSMLVRDLQAKTCKANCNLGVSIGVGVCNTIGGLLTAISAVPTGGASAAIGAGLTVAVCSGGSLIAEGCGDWCGKDPAKITKTEKDLEKLLNGQKEVLGNLTLIISQNGDLKKEILKNRAWDLIGDDLDNIDAIQGHWETVYDRFRAKTINLLKEREQMKSRNFFDRRDQHAKNIFLDSAFDGFQGILPSLKNIYQALTGRESMEEKSLWQLNPSLCQPTNLLFFMNLFTEGWLELGIAYAMKFPGSRRNGKPSVKENLQLTKWIIDITSRYYKDCGCVGMDGYELENRQQKLENFATLPKYDHTKDVYLWTSMPCLTKEKLWDMNTTIRQFNLNDALNTRDYLMQTEDKKWIYQIRDEDMNILKHIQESTNQMDGNGCPACKLFENTYTCYKKLPKYDEDNLTSFLKTGAHLPCKDKCCFGLQCVEGAGEKRNEKAGSGSCSCDGTCWKNEKIDDHYSWY